MKKMTKTVRHEIGISIEVPLIFLKEGKNYIAYTPALDLSSHGKTHREATAHFEEAIQLFLEELLSMGTLDEALMDLGWKKGNQTWKAPIEIENVSNVPFRVPIAA